MNKENIEVSDTNVGNIEKDINRCKELIKDKHKEWIGMTNQKAIGNVLEAYEKLQNKLLDTMKGTKIIREETLEYIKENYVSIQQIKEIVDECIPLKKNIITDKVEYSPNINANSYLSEQILKLLKERGII